MLSRNPSVILARLRCRRGSVLVLVAAAMFPIVGMLTFAIDVSHWFDYSRNLQNRADAAALGGGQMLGSCIGSTNTPGTTSNGLQSTAGKWAQLYSGASVGENSANVPYTDTQVSAATTAAAGSGNGPGTGWNVTTNGYINNTLPASPVTSPLTLTAGLANINNFWVALNGNNYPDSGRGNTSFKMNAAAAGATFCNSDPTFDATDKECFGQAEPLPVGSRLAADCASGPMVDVKLTQQSVPLFVPLFSGLNPTIHAHARVTLQGEASAANARAIAVSDPGSFACATVYFKNATTNRLLGTAKLAQTDAANFVWDNASTTSGSSGPVSFQMPSNANVYAQVFLNDCGSPPNGATYDDSTNSGLLYINSHPASDPTLVTGSAPQLAKGGVFLSGSCAPDQYFSVGACTDGVTAYVKFDPNIQKSKTHVSAVDWEWSATANNFVASNQTVNLTQDSTDPTRWYSANNSQMLNFNDSTGNHMIEIKWEQNGGSVTGKGTCSSSNSNPCVGSFGFQTASFSACNACDPADDSGPVILAQVCQSSSWPCFGQNSFAADSSPSLVVRLQLAGIRAETNAKAAPVVLRFPTSGNHQTGLVDCGQGQSGNLDGYVEYGGCGPNNPFISSSTCKQQSCPLPELNPLFVHAQPPRSNSTDCSPAKDQDYVDWPSGNHQDCVQTTPGTRRQNLVCALVLFMTGQSYTDPSAGCTGQAGGTCPYDYWPNPDTISSDPRKLTFILTSPVDLAAAAGAPLYWIPIRRFATFYVTGWDSSIKPSCGTGGPTGGKNEDFPGKGKTSQNGAIWGHWINDTDNGTSNGAACDTSSGEPTNCVPVLTR
jgi:hypothetical protein